MSVRPKIHRDMAWGVNTTILYSETNVLDPPPHQTIGPPDDLFFREPRDIGPPFKNPGHAPDNS